MKRVKKFKKCNRVNREIWKGKIWERDMKNRKEERKTESSRVRAKSRGWRIQKGRVTREIYGKVAI